MKANVLIESGEPVQAGDVLEHAPDGTTRPQRGTAGGSGGFARVLDPTPLDRTPSGSYRVRCEITPQRPFIPKTEIAA